MAKIEEEFRKLDPREHVLVRPDMYIGSITKTKEKSWVINDRNGISIFVQFSYLVDMEIRRKELRAFSRRL